MSILMPAQKYYPKLNDILFQREKMLGPKMQPLKSEIQRFSEKMFYDQYYFSNNISGSSTFTSLSFVPLRNNNYNFLGTGIGIMFNLHNPTKRTPIPIAYTENFSKEIEEDKDSLTLNKMESYLSITDSAAISLVFPHQFIDQLTRQTNDPSEIFAFNVSRVEISMIEAEDGGYAEIIFRGKFSQPVIIFDSSPKKEVDTVIIEIVSGKKRVLIPYIGGDYGGQYRTILFEEKF